MNVRDENRSRAWIATIIFVILAVAGVFCRSFFIKNITEFPMIVDNALLIDHAGTSYNVLSLEKIYTSLFSFFFSFVGNKASLAIYFQIILQVLSIMILFYAVKIFSNKITAWTCYLICIATPFAFSISVDQFFFMIFALILFLFGSYVHIINVKERSITLKWMSNFLVSLFVTRLIFLEPIFIVFVIFGLFVTMIYSTSEEYVLKTKIICGSSYLLGSILSVLSYVGIKYYILGEKIGSQISELVKFLFVLKNDSLIQVRVYIENMGVKETYIYLALGLFVLFLLFAFFGRDKKAPIIFSLLLVMISLYQFFFETEIKPYVVLGFNILLLLVLGVEGIIFSVLNFRMKKNTDVDIEKNMKHEQKLQHVEESEKENKIEECEHSDDELTTNELSKIKFIDNPLPLPKKHVSKKLEYRFEPKPEDMHYNI